MFVKFARKMCKIFIFQDKKILSKQKKVGRFLGFIFGKTLVIMASIKN